MKNSRRRAREFALQAIYQWLLNESAAETLLAQLREQLSGLGLARRSESAEPEDHIAALFEVMRHLIADPKRDLEEQKRFFERWIWPVVQPLCDAITKSELTPHYRPVAKFARAFLELEHSAFEML